MNAFWQGWRAMIPLYIGVIPFGLAYALTARSAGLGVFDTALMSVAVFAGAAQFSAVGLFAVGAAPLALVLTTFMINVRHLLYSLTLSQRVETGWPGRFLGAYFLTDEAFGVFVASGRRDLPYLLGCELSLFAVWNASTLIGALASGLVADPLALGVDFIFPLAFLALLIPLLENALDIAVAGLCAAGSLLLGRMLDPGLVILLVGMAGALLGAALGRAEPASPDAESASPDTVPATPDTEPASPDAESATPNAESASPDEAVPR